MRTRNLFMLEVLEKHLSIEYMTMMDQLHLSLQSKDGMIMSKLVMSYVMRDKLKGLLLLQDIIFGTVNLLKTG